MHFFLGIFRLIRGPASVCTSERSRTPIKHAAAPRRDYDRRVNQPRETLPFFRRISGNDLCEDVKTDQRFGTDMKRGKRCLYHAARGFDASYRSQRSRSISVSCSIDSGQLYGRREEWSFRNSFQRDALYGTVSPEARVKNPGVGRNRSRVAAAARVLWNSV